MSGKLRKANSRESGAALLLAMGMMSVAVFFGLVYAASATSSLRSSETSLQRYRAQTLAEGGLDKAIHRLQQNLGYSGVSGPDRFLGGALTVTVTASGNQRTVTSVVDFGGISSGYVAELSASSQLVVQDTAYIKAGIYMDNSNLSWGGLANIVGIIDENNGSVVDGRSQVLANIPSIVLNEGVLSMATSFLRTGDSALPGGSYDGRIYVDNGELTFGGAAIKSNGGVFCDGRLIIDPAGAVVRIVKDEDIDGGALYAKGDILIRNCSVLNINGSIFAEGNLIFENVSNARIKGSLIAGGQLILLNSTLEVSYDDSILDSLSPGVTGGRQSASLVEHLRRPFTGDTPPDPNEQANPPAADPPAADPPAADPPAAESRK